MTTTPTSGAADLPEARLFTKKPVTIAAIQWTGKNLREVIALTDGTPDTRTKHAGMAWEAYTDLVARDGLKIYTLEGTMLASPGDWIIRGVKGEMYPCKDEIFEATYSPAALAAGQATAAQPVVPAEWPTNEMIDAGRKAAASQGRLLGSGQSLWHVFRAMLAAAPAQPAAQQGAAYAALPDEREMLEHALWLASSFTVHRYLMSNAEGRWSGAEKATCHDELCRLYVAVFRGVEVDQVRIGLEADWMAVHDATQELTDHMDVVIGFPLKGVPDYEALAPKFFAYFHRLATHALRASHGQAPAGAGAAAEHYRNAIARARLLDSDLSNLTERGAKAWAGVDAQGLRDGGASPSANAGGPSAHIKEPYTIAEIKAKIDSNDYSAEMLLQHAMLLLDSASLSANAGQAGEYQALVCDYCGARTPDPWHSSGMLHGKMSKHIHSCDACAPHGQAPVQPVDFTTLGAAMRAIQQAIGLIGYPADERMQAVRRVLRGAVVVAEDSGDTPAQPDCLTCNDHGAVGNILTAEPCPDCTRWNVQPALATQHPEGGVVAYLDIGAGGYLDLGAALSEDALQQLPKGRHALVIAGTYGIDGYTHAPPAQTADSVQEDAACWHWLAEYLVGTRTDLDDEIVASETVNDLRKLVKAAIKQGCQP